MKKWIMLSIAALALLGPLSSGFATEYKDLAAPEVKMMVEQDGAILIHVLSRIEFDSQHIPGSINIPITEISSSDALPMQKEKPIIFY